jgi:hypothetical protein
MQEKEETLFEQWKQQRRNIPVPANFAAGVMAGIASRRAIQAQGPAGAPADFPSRLFKWSTGAGLLLLGLFRIIYITVNLLRANALMPY